MNTRKKKLEAVKNGGQYFAAGAGATNTIIDILSVFVRIPEIFKYPISAFIGLLCCCIGCNQSTEESKEVPVPVSDNAKESVAEEKAPQELIMDDEEYVMVVNEHQRVRLHPYSFFAASSESKQDEHKNDMESKARRNFVLKSI